MAIKYGSPLDLAKHELQNARIQNLASAPSSPVVGQQYFDTTIGKYGIYNGTDWDYMGTSEAAGDVTGPASSVDSEIALYSGTSGKQLKRMTGSGLVKSTSGVASTATEGTDYYAPGGTDVALADGGTGSSTAAGARSNLSVLPKHATYVVDAAGNGDYSTIQAAINALGTNKGRIYIKNGTYALGTTGLTITAGANGLELIGESKDGVQITYTGSGRALDVGASSADTRYLRFENFTISGDNNGTVGLRLNRVKNSIFKNLYITGFLNTGPGIGIRLDGTGSYTGDNYFYGIHVDTSAECISLTATSNANHFFGCTVRTSTATANSRGINMNSGTGNTFFGFTVENCVSGIRVNTDKNSFTGFYFEGNTTAIELTSSADDNVLVGMANVGTNTTFLSDSGTGNSIISGDTTKLKALTLGSALPVGSGGTGATTLTGLVKGNGTGAMTAAVAGTDYATADHDHAAADITDFDTEVSNNTDVAANTAARHTHSNSTVLNNTTASFTTADETKLDHISVSQAVDLDAIETRVNALDAAVVLMGTWDASAGTFPGSGSAQAGASYIVSVAGTVNGVAFSVNDRLLAITDNASTSTYASNWLKLDYTDQVLSVNGDTGAVVLDTADIADTTDKRYVTDAQRTVIQNTSGTNTGDEPTATTTAEGVVELATTAETKARSSSSVVVTPSGLADFTRGFAATIGDNSTSNIVVTHNLGTQDIVVSVRDASTNTGVEVEWEATSTNTATFKFASAPATNAYKVVILGL